MLHCIGLRGQAPAQDQDRHGQHAQPADHERFDPEQDAHQATKAQHQVEQHHDFDDHLCHHAAAVTADALDVILRFLALHLGQVEAGRLR